MCATSAEAEAWAREHHAGQVASTSSTRTSTACDAEGEPMGNSPFPPRPEREGGAAWQVSSLGDAKTSLGDVKSSLGDAKSSLGDAESSLGDAKTSLGDAESSLGDGKRHAG